MSTLSILFKCPKCGKPVCQRAYTMNLAFGYDEDQFCLSCLAELNEQALPDFFATGLHYVNSRECFQQTWQKLKDQSECPLKEGGCEFQQCFLSV